MKYSTKLMVVPFVKTIEKPSDKYINNLDDEMSKILSKNELNIDEKLKLYNNALTKFKEKYDPEASDFSENSIKSLTEPITQMIEKVNENTSKSINSSVEKIITEMKQKVETDKSDQEIEQRVQNLLSMLKTKNLTDYDLNELEEDSYNVDNNPKTNYQVFNKSDVNTKKAILFNNAITPYGGKKVNFTASTHDRKKLNKNDLDRDSSMSNLFNESPSIQVPPSTSNQKRSSFGESFENIMKSTNKNSKRSSFNLSPISNKQTMINDDSFEFNEMSESPKKTVKRQGRSDKGKVISNGLDTKYRQDNRTTLHNFVDLNKNSIKGQKSSVSREKEISWSQQQGSSYFV